MIFSLWTHYGALNSKPVFEAFANIYTEFAESIRSSKKIPIKFPTIDENTLLQLCSIVGDIRKEINTDSPRLSTMISTRNTIEIAELIMDGFIEI